MHRQTKTHHCLLHAKLNRHKQCAAFHTMSFPALSSPAFSTPAFWSRNFQSCIFHPCSLVPHFQVSHFPFSHFQRPRTVSNFATTCKNKNRDICPLDNIIKVFSTYTADGQAASQTDRITYYTLLRCITLLHRVIVL